MISLQMFSMISNLSCWFQSSSMEARTETLEMGGSKKVNIVNRFLAKEKFPSRGPPDKSPSSLVMEAISSPKSMEPRAETLEMSRSKKVNIVSRFLSPKEKFPTQSQPKKSPFPSAVANEKIPSQCQPDKSPSSLVMEAISSPNSMEDRAEILEKNRSEKVNIVSRFLCSEIGEVMENREVGVPEMAESGDLIPRKENSFKDMSQESIIDRDSETQQINSSYNDNNMDDELGGLDSEINDIKYRNYEDFIKCSEPLCVFKTTSQIKFSNHVNSHEKNKKLFHECMFCFRRFKNVSQLNDHTRLKHHAPVEPKVLCNLCGKFYRNCIKKEHVCNSNSNKQSKPKEKSKSNKDQNYIYQCSDCDYTSKLLGNVNRHIKSVHLNEFVYCRVEESCGFKTTRLDNLLRHEESHSQQSTKPPKNNPVKKKKCHENISSQKNNKLCYICGELVTSEKVHLFKKHKISDFQCTHCKKYFFAKQGLTKHLKKHDIITMFECTICGLRLNDSSNYKRHVKIHITDNSGSKQCPHCSYKTTDGSSLKRHLKIHDKKKVKCTICDRFFKNDKSMRKHSKRFH